MKQLANLLALILLISMGACSSDEFVAEDSVVNTEAEITEISAVIGELQYEESRTTVTMGDFNSSSISLVWAEKDTIGIYPTEGDQLSFPIVDGVGTNLCTFNGGGWALKTSTSYKAYSPFNRAYYYQNSDKLSVSMFGQKQVGNGNSDHLGKYDLQIAEGKTPEAGKISFSFKHQVCFIRMDLTAPTAATWKSITLESDALFTTEAIMNLASQTSSLTSQTTSNSVTLELEEVATTAENTTITAYMVVLPVDLTSKSLDVKLTDTNGNTYTTETEIANDYRNFKAGYARWIKAKDFQLTGITINVSQAGTLVIDKQNLTSLKIIGNLNGSDILHLRNYFGFDLTQEYTCHASNLEYLDLSETQIYSGGLFYCYLPGTDGESFCCTNDNTIGEYMFYGLTNLKQLVFPESVTMIERNAFRDCTNLRSVHIPNNITIIENSAFIGCSNLTHVSLSNNLSSIGYCAFQGCTSLERITLPESLTSIDFQAFYGCTSLVEVKIKATIPPTLNNATTFANCSSDLKIYVPAESLDAYKAADYWKNLNIVADNQ